MPYLQRSSYAGNKLYKGSHLETIVPALFRKLSAPYHRERLELADGDFLDLDFMTNGHQRVLVLFHGLEGSSNSSYMKGMALNFFKNQWDVCCVNFRSCSGEPNRLLRSYHSGATEDIDAVMQHLLTKPYQMIAAGGFSLGGNMLLKYLGEQVYPIPSHFKAAFAYSVPVDLAASSEQMAKASNRLYMQRFLKTLRSKMIAKAAQFPGRVDLQGISSIRNFTDFDNRYTAPLNGFKDALHYYQTCNSLQFIKTIKHPTLLVNAHNDPFLAPSCFPVQLAAQHPLFHLETPYHGGHVGFSEQLPGGNYWSETRALSFISSFCN